ncbi:Eukaryotic translation initiation factor 4E type 2 [Smittium mucronatum]|uniref:Eukaryotic translation initiation factor 4E type 2 n=1 Tax=Smittium mucronatum TaxID=133383 RepID=A0A1R0H2U0_9FUNG|nr:Eukaryotic translation initiation factor 4E type 2 [Smittium mucronatum]
MEMATETIAKNETLTFAKAVARSNSQSNKSVESPSNPEPANIPSESTSILPKDSISPSGLGILNEENNSISPQDTSAPVSSEKKPGGNHPLQYQWTFWFMHRYPGQKIVDYEAAISKISSFKTIEEFWDVYSYICRPSDMPTVSDFHLFKYGVRPVWEDEINIEGGKWMIRIKKGLSSRLWERLIFAIIGNQFQVGEEICGAVLSIRNSEDIISLWNKTANDAAINISIRDTIKTVLQIPSETVMEYKAHNDSLRDNSSFRNTEVYK